MILIKCHHYIGSIIFAKNSISFYTSFSETCVEADRIFSEYNAPDIMMTFYKDHILLLCSISSPTSASIKNECTPIIGKLYGFLPPCALGRSNIHINPVE